MEDQVVEELYIFCCYLSIMHILVYAHTYIWSHMHRHKGLFFLKIDKRKKDLLFQDVESKFWLKEGNCVAEQGGADVPL